MGNKVPKEYFSPNTIPSVPALQKSELIRGICFDEVRG
jgi:hypothetical protein